MAWAGATPTAPESQEDNSDGTTITTDAVTLTAGRLYFFGAISRRGDSTDVAAPTSVLCNGTEAFTIVDATNGLVLHDTAGASRKGIWVGYAIPAGNVTGTIVATWAASQTNIACILVEVTSGFDSGAPFLQTAKVADEDGTGTTTTLTFGSGMASDSLVVVFYGDSGTGTLGPGTGYTELVETVAAGSGGVLAAAYNTAPDTTFDWTYTVGNEAGAIGIEIKAASAGASTGPGIVIGSSTSFVGEGAIGAPDELALAGAQAAATGTIAVQRLLTHVTPTGAQPEATGTVVAKLALMHISLAGVQPTATGGLALIKTLKTLAGAQPQPTGAIASEFVGGVVEVTVTGAQPTATGTVTSLRTAFVALAGAQPSATGRIVVTGVRLTGAQPASTGTIAFKRLLTHIALAGAQLTATGTIASIRTSFAAVAGAQPAATGAVAFKRSLSHFTLAGSQANATGALALITTLKLLAGAQVAATGTIAVQRLLTHVTPTGAQPEATGSVVAKLSLIHISLAGSQPNDTGTIAAVSAQFVELAGEQPAPSGTVAIDRLLTHIALSGVQGEPAGTIAAHVVFSSVVLAGAQPSATGLLVALWLVVHLVGAQPAGSGALTVLVPATGVGFAPVGGLAVLDGRLGGGRAEASHLGVGTARAGDGLGRGRGRLGL